MGRTRRFCSKKSVIATRPSGGGGGGGEPWRSGEEYTRVKITDEVD